MELFFWKQQTKKPIESQFLSFGGEGPNLSMALQSSAVSPSVWYPGIPNFAMFQMGTSSRYGNFRSAHDTISSFSATLYVQVL